LIDDAGNMPCPSNGNFSTSILKLALTVLGYNVDSTIGKRVADHDFEKDRAEETLIGYIINYGNYHWVSLLYTGTNYLYKDSIEKSAKPEMAPIPYKTVKEYLAAKADGGKKIEEFYKVSTGGVPSMDPIQAYKKNESEQAGMQGTLNARKAALKRMLKDGINEGLKGDLALVIDTIYEDAQVEKMTAILSEKTVINTIEPENITNHIDAFLLVYGLSTDEDENEAIKQIQDDLTKLFALSDAGGFTPVDIMSVYFICCKYKDAHEILSDSIGKDDGINGVLSRKYSDIHPKSVNGQPERKSTKEIRCQILDIFIGLNIRLTIKGETYSTSDLESSSVYKFCHGEVVELGDEEEEEEEEESEADAELKRVDEVTDALLKGPDPKKVRMRLIVGKMVDAIMAGVLDKKAAKEFMITNGISTKEYLEQPGKLPTYAVKPSKMTPEIERRQNEARLALARMMIGAVEKGDLNKKAVQEFIKGPLGYNPTKGGTRRKRPQGSGAVTRRLR
jgi:hypothetical protein